MHLVKNLFILFQDHKKTEKENVRHVSEKNLPVCFFHIDTRFTVLSVDNLALVFSTTVSLNHMHWNCIAT